MYSATDIGIFIITNEGVRKAIFKTSSNLSFVAA